MKQKMNNLLNTIDKHTFLASVACVLLPLFLYLALNSFKFVYASYDDYPFVVFLTHGDDTFLYIGVFLSHILSFLQSVFPNISVYPIFLVVSSIASFLALTYVLIRKFPKIQGLFFSLVFNLVFINISIICLQYTQISGLICLSASSLIICALQFENRKKYKIIQLIFGIVLMIIGSQLRFDPFIPCALFSVVYCVCICCRRIFRCEQKGWIKKLVFSLKQSLSLVLAFLVVLPSVFALNYASNIVKINTGFGEKLLFNDARTLVQDYQVARYEGSELFYKTQDVYSIDDFILLTCFKVDMDVYTTEKMNNIAQYSVDHNTGKINIYYEFFRSMQKKVCNVFGNGFLIYPILGLGILFVVFIFIFLFRIRNRIKYLFIAALFVLWVVFAFWVRGRYNLLSDSLLLAFIILSICIAVSGNRFQYIGLYLFNITLITVIFYMIYTRLPFRAEFTVVVPSIYFLLLLFNYNDIRVGVRKKLVLVPCALRIIVAVSCSSFFVVFMQFELNVFYYTSQESQYDDDLVDFITSNNNAVFFYDCYGCDLLDHAKYDPFAVPDYPENTIQYGGWPAASNFYDNQLVQNNVKHLYKEMINNPNRYFVITKNDIIDDKLYTDRLSHFYNLHYKSDKEINFNEVYSTENAWVYQVVEI